MKKIILALALVMALSFGASAQGDGFVTDWSTGGDLFRIGFDLESLLLPMDHGLTENQSAPIGSGLFILTALGAGYAVTRRRRE